MDNNQTRGKFDRVVDPVLFGRIYVGSGSGRERTGSATPYI